MSNAFRAIAKIATEDNMSLKTQPNDTLVETFVSIYSKLRDAADPRVENMLLMQSPFPVTAICCLYIYFVLRAGPEFMKNRKPFNLRPVLIVYNAAQTIFSAWLFYKATEHWVSYNGFGCIAVDATDTNDTTLWGVQMCHLYFLSKISELADTIFFVLKKKDSHVSLLHVFHHAVMPFSVWFGVKFTPGGNLTFFGLPNLFVHIWMYLYYMLAAMGPQYQKFVWWKRHITEMQLAQFAIVMVYMIYVSHQCQLSRYFTYWIIAMDIVFVILFVDFYVKSYLKKKSEYQLCCNVPLQKLPAKVD